jgi:PAS domain S-box-containing protein
MDEIVGPDFLFGDAKFRALAEGMACAIFISEGERQLRYVNHAAETITGYAREELLSKTFGAISLDR